MSVNSAIGQLEQYEVRRPLYRDLCLLRIHIWCI